MTTHIVMMTRMASQRTPNKACAELAGEAAFHRVLERIGAALPNAPKIVCTTSNLEDDAVAILSRSYGYDLHRTPETDSAHGFPRMMDLIRCREMDDTDVVVWAANDTPFCYCDSLPQAIEMLKIYDCGRFTWAENPNGTLLWGVQMPYAFKVWGFKQAYRDYSSMEFHSWWTPWCDEGKRLLLTIPENMRESWPWAQLLLDHPLQVSQAKIIYRALWRGEPLDVHEVYEYLHLHQDVAGITDGIPGTTKYGQHLDRFWKAYHQYPHVTVDLGVKP